MRTPLVTVVTPSYNQGPFIRATIESVLTQDYPNVEYIVMDGGSTDETASIVRDYGDRVKWISEKDEGQSHAINKGFQMARGEFVAWLNSDDVFLPGAIARAARELVEHPEYAAVYGEGYQIDREGQITSRFPVTENFNLWKLVHMSDYILQQTVFFRRSALEAVGWLDQSLHYSMDWDVLIRLGLGYQLGYIPAYLGCLREYPEAKTFSGGRARAAEIARMLRRYTGNKYPPGMIIYGLDAYRKIWCYAIDSRLGFPLGWLSAALQWCVNIVCLHIIGWHVIRAQGWYRDRWTDKEVRLMAPSHARSMVVRGYLPPRRHECIVRAVLDGTTELEFPGRSGKFRMEIPLDPSEHARTVVLRMENFGWVPRPGGRRPRYLRLDRVEFTWPGTMSWSGSVEPSPHGEPLRETLHGDTGCAIPI